MNSGNKNRSICSRVSRRGFVRGAAGAVGGFVVVPRYVLGGSGYAPPSEKINIAIISTGGQGLHNIRALFGQADAQVIAICDVNEESDYSRFYYRGTAGSRPALQLIEKRYADRKTAGEYKGCACYVDFRKMLEKEKAIDAVLVATPDHIHAVATMAAIKNGK
ncbi:MAG: Gfo/Idh/MocA family oxidoreductase, partial [Phycisphaerales bacterium]